MSGELFLAALLVADTLNPIQGAIERYQSVAGYRLTLKSSTGNRIEMVRYSFKKPGHVRMEFIKPFKGAVLVYDPATKQAKLWPFGYGSFPALTLSPENRLIRSSTGQRVDQSDMGALYRNVSALQERGKTEIMGTEPLGEKETVHVVIEGEAGFSVGAVHRYQLWLDVAAGFPVKVSSHDAAGRVIEVVEMGDLQINPEFPEGFFGQ